MHRFKHRMSDSGEHSHSFKQWMSDTGDRMYDSLKTLGVGYRGEHPSIACRILAVLDRVLKHQLGVGYLSWISIPTVFEHCVTMD